ncbi:MAG: rhodanese-like domain-containing protein [Thermodesulfobacteriota bacterium]|nr:rhodanese-like domain-containing protein [Thermodesulfobacteriota bacterium]
MISMTQDSMPHCSVFIPFLTLIIFIGCFSLSVCKASSLYDLALIEPHVLNRDISAWVILDARPRDQWLDRHLPGARSFCWEDYTRTDEKRIPYRVWPPEEMAEALGEMGIDENSPIIVYGDADRSWGGEGWTCWVLVWLGHRGPIRLLNGGIQAWKSNDFPLVAEASNRKSTPVGYKVKLRTEVSITTEELQQQGSNLLLVDTRSTLEWLKGHLPDAVHIHWTKFFSGKERRPISHNEMRRLMKHHGITNGKPVVYYCTGGIRSAYAWLIHELSGLGPARNYEGGTEAWKRR